MAEQSQPANRMNLARRKSRVGFRPLEAGDVDAIVALDQATWYSDGGEHSREMAALESCGLLERVTWSNAALIDGRFVGMITAAVKGEDPLAEDVRRAFADRFDQARETLSKSASGRKVLHDYDVDAAENEHFEAQARRELDAEAVLFFLDPSARGHQLGKRLFDSLVDHLDAAGLKTYWLFTDSTCSFGFYDHRGMRRTATLKTRAQYMPGVTKYIYTGFVDEDVQRYANVEDISR